MIRHVPEGIVPFDECGYSRSPCVPFVGQKICLGVFCDEGIPVLEVNGTEAETAAPVSSGEKTWKFTLSPFTEAGTLRYRFVCGSERTQWFSVDILRKVCFQTPQETGPGWVKLSHDLYLNFQGGASFFSVSVASAPEEAPVVLPEPWNLSCGEKGIWELKYGNDVRALCREIVFGIHADGTAAWRETVVRGKQIHVWGTGERFDSVDQQGRGSCGQVVEHFTKQGPWTYLPVPFFMTDAGFGYYQDSACNVSIRFEEDIRIASWLLSGRKEFWLMGTPAGQLSTYMQKTGSAEVPPEWAFGLWISANGWKNDRDVDAQLKALRTYRCPASVMVLEAWSDESTFYRWSQAWKNPEAMVRRVREAGLHLVLWQIPVFKDPKDCPERGAVERDRALAVSKGWIVRQRDGMPYIIPERWFEGGLLPDFTNPEACSWWFSRRDHLLDAGVEGFKTDGGEFLYGSDLRLHDGTDGREAHNLYPMLYERAYRDWMRRKGVRGVIFSRAGYAGAQTVPIHWAGDQLSTWEELSAQLTAGISAGLSGVLFWGFDIGGFAGELPDAELYLRATAFACFCPVMQWHAEPRNGQFYATHDEEFNNDRSPWNLAEKLKCPEIIEIACDFARLREQLRPWLWKEAQYCVENSRPMMAHLCLDFPEDAQALDCGDEYMLGRRFLVAPVVNRGAKGRTVYFPAGTWKHYLHGETVHGPAVRELSCPMSEALVYERTEA